MHFSLRWLFAATAYAAVVTAAIATGKPWLADVVWGVSILAMGYASIVSIISRRRRRAVAVGFVVFSTANLIVWLYFANRTPVMIGFRAAGYSVSREGEVNEPGPKGGGLRAVFQINSVRVANGVGILIAGFVGCLVGGIAYSREESRHGPH